MEEILVICGILFLLGVLVFILFYGKKQDTKSSSLLKEIARKHNLKLDKKESASSLLLGLDKKNNTLIVVEPKNNEDPLVIDLRQVVSCEVQVKSTSHEKQDKDLISLMLFKKNDRSRATEIIFYDKSDIETRNRLGQIEMARRWCQYVTEAVQKKATGDDVKQREKQ